MKHPSEGRHIADKRSPSNGARAARFIKLARRPRETFQRTHSQAGATRLIQFLRIERGGQA